MPRRQPRPERGREGRLPAPLRAVEPTPADVGLGRVEGSGSPQFCPRCGAPLRNPDSFIQELWTADVTLFHCWCRECWFVFNVVLVERMVGHGLDED